MLRKVVAASLILVLSVGVAFAEQIRAVITKVDGNKVTFSELKGKGKRGDEQTLPAAENVKVVRAKFNKESKTVEVGKELKGGLTHKMFSKIPEKGRRAVIITDADNKKITEIRIFGGRGKKKKNQ